MRYQTPTPERRTPTWIPLVAALAVTLGMNTGCNNGATEREATQQNGPHHAVAEPAAPETDDVPILAVTTWTGADPIAADQTGERRVHRPGAGIAADRRRMPTEAGDRAYGELPAEPRSEKESAAEAGEPVVEGAPEHFDIVKVEPATAEAPQADSDDAVERADVTITQKDVQKTVEDLGTRAETDVDTRVIYPEDEEASDGAGRELGPSKSYEFGEILEMVDSYLGTGSDTRRARTRRDGEDVDVFVGAGNTALTREDIQSRRAGTPQEGAQQPVPVPRVPVPTTLPPSGQRGRFAVPTGQPTPQQDADRLPATGAVDQVAPAPSTQRPTDFAVPTGIQAPTE